MNKLEKSLKERDEFLKNHPHLIEYQKEIDRILDACDPGKRLEVLGMMISGKLLDQQAELVKLLSIVNQNMQHE